jgi:hypothetical protein
VTDSKPLRRKYLPLAAGRAGIAGGRVPLRCYAVTLLLRFCYAVCYVQ